MKKNILIIDDDASMCMLLDRILSSKYEVNSCSNAMDALCWLIEGNFPDLVVTDIIMPTLTGIEFLKTIKESGILKSIPVIILSGHDDPNERKKCTELGAERFLLKPFTPGTLVEAIDGILTR